jgi:trigger factor
MQVSVESGEGLERKMRIDLPFEQIQGEVDKRLQSLARSARLPGFRPGKVPMKLLRQRYGEQVQQEVFGELVQSSFSEAVATESLRPAGMPRIEPDIDRDAQRFAYTAIFEVLPQIEPGDLSGKQVKRPMAEVADTDLEAMLERLRAQRKTWEPVERPAERGDRLTVAYVGTIDGDPFPGGASDESQIEIGAGRMIPGFEDGLVGAVTGETRTIDVTFPEGYQAEHLAGKPARFEVTIKAVNAPVLPEIDSEFARAFGIDDGDVTRLRADVRTNMERELKERLKARTKERVMDLLIETNPVDIPSALVAEEVRALKEQMREKLGGGQMELPDNLFEESARRRVVLGLIIAELVKRQGIAADPARVRETVQEMASTYEDPQEVVDYYYADRRRLASVESLVLEDQVVDWVLSQVTVEDEPTTFAQITEGAAA